MAKFARRTSFDKVASEYDLARPDYPSAVYDALGPIRDAIVLEGGAGTGIATRALIKRGASVVPFDVGWNILRRAVQRSLSLRSVIADGSQLPFRDECADLICFAQSWHWLHEDRRVDEAARVLRPGGRWAGWWSHSRADDEMWFNACWDLVESACPDICRNQRDTNWGDDIDASGRFVVEGQLTFPWIRRVSVSQWLTDQRSHSYIADLSEVRREQLMGQIAMVVRSCFPNGIMNVRYETRMWIARVLSLALRPENQRSR